MRQFKVMHADLISELQSKFNDDPELPCCSCEHLFHHKQMSCVNFSLEQYNTEAWLRFKAHILLNGDAGKMYICHFCQSFLKKNAISAKCVLNGLVTEPVPEELIKVSRCSQ